VIGGKCGSILSGAVFAAMTIPVGTAFAQRPRINKIVFVNIDHVYDPKTHFLCFRLIDDNSTLITEPQSQIQIYMRGKHPDLEQMEIHVWLVDTTEASAKEHVEVEDSVTPWAITPPLDSGYFDVDWDLLRPSTLDRRVYRLYAELRDTAKVVGQPKSTYNFILQSASCTP